MNVENDRQRLLDDVETVNQVAQWNSKDEAMMAMKKMKDGQAVAPDDIPVKAWCLGATAVQVSTRLLNKILESDWMLKE